MQKTVKVLFKFEADSASKPMIFFLARDYNIVFSILQADIKPGEGGRIIMDLKGEEDDLQRGLEYAKKCGVSVKTLTKAIVWNEDTCVHCGTCTAVCTHKALVLDQETAQLSYNNENCVVCEMCVPTCPTGSIRTDMFE